MTCTLSALRRLRVLISLLLQYIYCLDTHLTPSWSFTRLRDLTFLPHLLQSNKPTGDITVEDMAGLAHESAPAQMLTGQINALLEEVAFGSGKNQLQENNRAVETGDNSHSLALSTALQLSYMTFVSKATNTNRLA